MEKKNMLDHETKPTIGEILVRPFQPGDETPFRLLNEQWIEQHFKLEGKDRKSFADPQTTIIARGGRILIAVARGRSIGCCALLCMGKNEFEVAKMAVAPEYQGRGIGRLLLSSTVEEARRLGAKRLYLETNHILKPAIALYESLGFRHIDPAKVTPSPYERADIYMELILNSELAPG